MNEWAIRLDQWHASRGAELTGEPGAGQVLRYGSTCDTEIKALQEQCGLLERKARWLLEVQGPEAAAFLQGLVTQEVKTQPVGSVRPGLICSSKGKVEHRVELLRPHEETFWVSCEPGEGMAVGRLLDQFHVREDVTFSLKSRTHLRMDLVGPQTAEIGASLEQRGFLSSPSSGCFRMTASFGNLPAETWVVPWERSLEFLEVLESGLLVGESAWEAVRISQGLPRIGVEFGAGNFAQEAALGDHISYTKGCYIGQEPNARMYHRGHPNWELVGVGIPCSTASTERLSFPLPEPVPLYFEGEACGELRSFSPIRHQEEWRGIAWIRHAVAQQALNISPTPEDTEPWRLFALPHHILRPTQ
jgi:folate-binding protein YgfZ